MKRKRASHFPENDEHLDAESTQVRKSARARKPTKQDGDDNAQGQASPDDSAGSAIAAAYSTTTPSRTKRLASIVKSADSGPRRKASTANQRASRRPVSEKPQDSEDEVGNEDEDSESAQSSDELHAETVGVALSKEARKGRPRAKRKRDRTPTPPRTLPPHEHYFFQNRPGGNKTSNNTFSSVSLLSHEEYFEIMKEYEDPHQNEIDFLHDLHAESFDQWLFELEEGFNICLYGWGGKRKLLLDFAEHAAANDLRLEIVVMNGFVPDTTVRSLFETLASVIPSLKGVKIPANASDALNTITSALSDDLQQVRYLLLINSLDAAPLRRPPAQSLLARLASLPSVSLVATCDTTHFPVLWDVSLKTQFNWVFHDATTYASYDAELGGGVGTTDDDGVATGNGVIDIVNGLLGRSGRKVHGREGVVFVLRSLTESARRLYGLLVAEVLSADDGVDGQDIDGMDVNPDVGEAAEVMPTKRKGKEKQAHNATLETSSITLEYRTMYKKAVQSLIATSEMQFRQLLKEFYDHEMLMSKKDSMGSELLSLPFRRDELESILEEIEVES